jgi:hypothetical protein
MTERKEPQEPTHDEICIDLDDEDPLDEDRGSLEGLEFLGSYPSIPAYLRAMLEPEVTPACSWILDHVDWVAVQLRWEGDGSRLVVEHGHVFRLAAPAVGDGLAGP